MNTAISSSHATVRFEPNWSAMKVLCRLPNVAAAMDQFYKSERLNRPDGTRERLIADREAALAQSGFGCLASHFDSVTGQGLWLRLRGKECVVYSSTDQGRF